jgi:hypothetical protein
MINLKKINKLREGISLRDRTASQYGNIIGPKHGMDDNSSENIPYNPKTESGKKLKAALTKMGQDLKDHPKLKEAKDPREYDYEGDMAKSQLRSIISNAQEIHDMLEDNTNIAEWVQSKITLSADYITTVRDYMNSEVNEGSVNFHTTIAQSAKGLSTKHKHSALALKSKFKPDVTKYKVPTNEASSLAQQAAIAIDMKKRGVKPSLLDRVKKMNKQNQDTEQKKLDTRTSVEEATGDPSFDKMLKGITGKRQVAKQQKTDTKQQARDAFGSMFGGGNPASNFSIRKKSTNEEVEPIDEISKDLAKSYLDKTVDPVYGMPRHGMQNRMKGIRQASIRVLKKADKSKIKTN